MLQRSLQVGAHHRVVDNDDRVGRTLLDLLAYCCEVCDFQERIRGRLEEHHGCFLGIYVRKEGCVVGGVYMVDDDAYVGSDVRKKAVSSAIQVISSDDLVPWL